MRKRMNRCLAVFLALAMTAGNALPVRAADAADAWNAAASSSEEAETENPEAFQETGEEVPGTSKETGEETSEGGDGAGTEDEAPLDTPEETEPSAGEGDTDAPEEEPVPSGLEEITAPEPDILLEDGAARGEEVKVYTLSEKTIVPLWEAAGMLMGIICTPEVTGYYRLSDDAVGDFYVHQCYNTQTMEPAERMPKYNENEKKVEGLYKLEKGEYYRVDIRALKGIPEEVTEVTIERVAKDSLPVYKDISYNTEYTTKPGETGYYMLRDEDNKGFFIGSTPKNYIVVEIEGYSDYQGQDVPVFQETAETQGYDNWQWYAALGWTPIIVPPNENTETRIICRRELNSVFEEIPQWGEAITIGPNTSRFFAYDKASTIGDYLIEHQEGLNFIPFTTADDSWDKNWISSLQVQGKTYDGFRNVGTWNADGERRFILENTTENSITVTLVTDQAFGREALQLGKNSDAAAKGPYFTFTAPEDGIYSLNGILNDNWMRKGKEKISNFRDSKGRLMEKGETVELCLTPRGQYEFAPEILKKEVQPITEIPFTIPASQEEAYYVFIPPRTGEYQCTPHPETIYDYFGSECYLNGTGWDGGGSYGGGTFWQQYVWEGWEQKLNTLKEGEKYYFCASSTGNCPATITLRPLNRKFTAVKNWTAPITLKDGAEKCYSLTGAAAGDYLIKLSDDFELLTFETAGGAEYKKVQVHGETYACVSFDGTKAASWKFSLRNQKPSQDAVTVQPVTWIDIELMEKISVGETKSVPQTGELPGYYYYSFTPEETGAYEVQGDLRRACKKDGTALDTKAGKLILVKGETCYLSLESGDEEKTLLITQDENCKGLDGLLPNKDDTLTLESGQEYLYVPDKDSDCLAFTSRLEREEAAVEYNDGAGWKEWTYDPSSGNYKIRMAKRIPYLLRVTTADNAPVKIGYPGHSYGAAVTVSPAVSSLKDEDLKGQGSASRMSAAYSVKGTEITAKGTLKRVENCLDALGWEDTYRSGHFLALRLNVAKMKLKEDGYVSVTYEKNGQKEKKFFEYRDTETLRNNGYVDVILDMNEDLKEVQIRVGVNSLASVKTYVLKLSGLVKEVSPGTGGAVSEAGGACQVKTSSPVMGTDPQDRNAVKVSYRSVAYSTGILLPGGTAPVSGNYGALRVLAPESMANTPPQVKVECAEGAVEGLYTEPSADGSQVLLIFEAGRDSSIFGKTLVLTWSIPKAEGAASEPNQVVQKIQVEKADNCYFETIPEGVELPKSIAINGLNGTMYVGQTQDIVTTITRKYEEDKVYLTYSSSDPAVLHVNRVTGEMEALKAGTAVITVEAVDGREGSKPLAKTAKVTVKAPTAPGSVKVTEIKDESVKVSWGKNSTGQKITVYAVPYREEEMGKAAAGWKTYIEGILEGTEEESLPQGWRSAETENPAAENSVRVEGLAADTVYVFYVRNETSTSAGTRAFAGSTSGKTTTKKAIFDEAEIVALDGGGQELPGEGSEPGKYTVSGTAELGKGGLPASIGYKFYKNGADGSRTEMDKDTVYSGVGYKTTNGKVVKVSNKGVLTLGGEAGTAELYVTGKDAAGTVRETDRITIEVIKAPTKLKDKSTTLVIGQSVALKELIAYDGVKGALSQIDTEKVDFPGLWKELEATGSFKREGTGEVTGETLITAADFLENDKSIRKAGNSTKVSVSLKDGKGNNADTKKATVKVNDMGEPAIKSVTAGDTGVWFTFTPNATVREPAGAEYYYTVSVTDMVTGRPVAVDARNGASAGMRVAIGEAAESTPAKPVYTCEITGLSSNKKYRLFVKAHYDAAVEQDGGIIRNEKVSRNKDVTTKKRLLASEGSLSVRYLSLPELKAHPDGSTAKRIGENDTEKQIYLKNNETYVLMAEVSDLARVLETDKLKWSISSGDKKAASIKASTSSFEAQLVTQRTGTFTVTAVSTVTKEILVTFTVTVDPFQSGDRTAGQRSEMPQAWLGSQEQAGLPEEEKKECA